MSTTNRRDCMTLNLGFILDVVNNCIVSVLWAQAIVSLLTSV